MHCELPHQVPRSLIGIIVTQWPGEDGSPVGRFWKGGGPIAGAPPVREWIRPLLRCPDCGDHLQSRPSDLDKLACKRSGQLFPVVDGVPRLLPERLRGDARPLSMEATASEMGLQRRTSRVFGLEWTRWARFGWDDPVYNLERERFVFLSKSLLRPEEMNGRLILDAGCGNGRYSYWASRFGGRVVGVDLGDGVKAASTNTASMPSIQVIQADIFSLPFSDETFDIVFCIGVLMHTGDAKRAFASLVNKVKQGGSLCVHLYGRGNHIYEFVDRTLRARTTQLTNDQLLRLTDRLHAMRRRLDRAGLAGIVARFVRLDEHPHCIFDWYAAPVATHHTYAEVRRWFKECRVAVTAEGLIPPAGERKWKSWIRPMAGRAGTVTIRGQRMALRTDD